MDTVLGGSNAVDVLAVILASAEFLDVGMTCLHLSSWVLAMIQNGA